MVELEIVQLLLRWMWFTAEKDHGYAMACVEELKDWCFMVLLALGRWPCLNKIGTLYVCAGQALAAKREKLPFPKSLDDVVAVSMDQINAAPLQKSLWNIRDAPYVSAIKHAGTGALSSLKALNGFYIIEDAPWGTKNPIGNFLDECLFWCSSLEAILDAPSPPGADGGEGGKRPCQKASESA